LEPAQQSHSSALLLSPNKSRLSKPYPSSDSICLLFKHATAKLQGTEEKNGKNPSFMLYQMTNLRVFKNFVLQYFPSLPEANEKWILLIGHQILLF